MVVIAGEVIAGVKLDTMAIGIADIQKKRIGDTVAARPALDIFDKAAGRHHIAEVQDIHRRRHPVGKMVQARAVSVGNGKVVDIALAMHPGRGDAAIRSVLFAIFGEPKTQPRIEVDRVLNFGGEYVEMVEPLRMAALVEIVATQQMGALLHRGIELDLKAEGVGEMQRAALERLLGEPIADAVFRTEAGCLLEIVFVADLEAEPAAGGARRPAQHQRVMLMLLAAAQVHRVIVAVLDMQPNGVFIKLAAGVEVHHIEHDVAAADDVEWRVEDVLRNGHRVSLVEFVIPGWSEGPAPESRDSGFAPSARPGMTAGSKLPAAESCAYPGQGTRAWSPCRSRMNNRRRRGRCRMISCRRMASADAGRFRNSARSCRLPARPPPARRGPCRRSRRSRSGHIARRWRSRWRRSRHGTGSPSGTDRTLPPGRSAF